MSLLEIQSNPFQWIHHDVPSEKNLHSEGNLANMDDKWLINVNSSIINITFPAINPGNKPPTFINIPRVATLHKTASSSAVCSGGPQSSPFSLQDVGEENCGYSEEEETSQIASGNLT